MSATRALAETLEQVRNCQLCAAHLPHAPRPVVQAAASARILIAGQAPGRKVQASGIPFDDPSGDRLRRWLGVDRSTFYNADQIAILPMGFCYPGHGTRGDLPPRQECAPAWRELLLQQLPRIELTVVLGRHAMAYHLPGSETALSECVRNWRNHWPQAIPLPHPSPRNNIWLHRNPWFERDVIPALQQRVRQLLAHQS